MEFLRNNRRCLLPASQEARDELLLEAEFYGLSDLASKLRRYKLLDSYCMTFDQTTGVLHGNRYAGAIFDVLNPEKI